MLSPYLYFNGNCDEAFRFYEQVFKAKVAFRMTHDKAPPDADIGPEWKDKIMHIALPLGNGTMLLANDLPAQWYSKPQGFHVSYSTTTPEAERIFAALSEGGTVTMKLEQTFWAERFGSVTDRFGTPWMIGGGNKTPDQF